MRMIRTAALSTASAILSHRVNIVVVSGDRPPFS